MTDVIIIILMLFDDDFRFAESWLVAATFYDLVVSRPFRWFKHSQLLADDLELEYKGETTGGHPEDYLNKGRLMSNYLACKDPDTVPMFVHPALPKPSRLVVEKKGGKSRAQAHSFARLRRTLSRTQTTKRCRTPSRRTGYWSSTSSRAGPHSASSWASRFRR